MNRVITFASGKGGVGKSLAFDEYVSLADGRLVQIGPFVDQLISENSQVAKKVVFKTVNGKEETFEIIESFNGLILDTFLFNQSEQRLAHTQRKPVCLMRKPAPNRMVRIDCASGNVSVTPEHSFIVMRNGTLQKVTANEIIPKKDFLVLFKSIRDVENRSGMPVDVAQWLGFLTGDGYMEGYTAHVFCEPNGLLPCIRGSFQSVFGEYKELVSRGLHRISFYKQGIIKELYKKYGVTVSLAGEKSVPEALFTSNNASVAAFISALFDCDGTVNRTRKEIEFDSKSKQLVLEVASLLRTRFGICSQIKETFKLASNSKLKKKAAYWRLYVTGENASTFAKFIGFNHPQKSERLHKNIRNSAKINTNIDVYPVGKILKRIREEGNKTALQVAKKLGVTKQMVFEYEWQYYALSKTTVERFIQAFMELGLKSNWLGWLEKLLESNLCFRRVEEKQAIDYDWPFVYDFQVSELGGHFVHSSGIILSNTTVTANVGISLAQLGFKVCLIDADIAMANLSLLLGMQSSPITLHDVLLGEASIDDAIYDGPVGVKFVPSGLSLDNYRRVDSERLESVISNLKERFDFVLLDAPAGIEKNVLAALAAAEEVILITMPESPSIADVLKTKLVSERLGSKPIGIIVNFVYGEKGEIPTHDIMRMLELPSYGTVPFDQEVRKSFMREKVLPVVLRSPNCSASRAFRAVAGRIAGVQVKEEKKEQGGLAKLFNSLSSLFKRKKK